MQDPKLALAQKLRAQGATYREIAKAMDISHGKVWIILNRARHNVNSRESAERYKARGCVALADMPKSYA